MRTAISPKKINYNRHIGPGSLRVLDHWKNKADAEQQYKSKNHGFTQYLHQLPTERNYRIIVAGSTKMLADCFPIIRYHSNHHFFSFLSNSQIHKIQGGIFESTNHRTYDYIYRLIFI
jgi:hypothetical protein